MKEQAWWTAERELISIRQKEKLGWWWLWTGVVELRGCKSIWSDTSNSSAHQISYILSNGRKTVSISIIYYSPGACDGHRYVFVLSVAALLWELFGTSFNRLRAQMEYFQPLVLLGCPANSLFLLVFSHSFMNLNVTFTVNSKMRPNVRVLDKGIWR